MRPAPLLLALALLVGCGEERQAPPPTGILADGLPASADGLALDGRVIVPAREVPSGPGEIHRAINLPAVGWSGVEKPWGEQRAEFATFTPPADFDFLGAWIAANERRQTLGVGDQTFRTVAVMGTLRTPVPGTGTGPVWAVHKEGILRGTGTAHAVVAWDGTRHVIKGYLRGTPQDLLASFGDDLLPWRAYSTRLRRALEKGADLRQMVDDLAILAHLAPDVRGEAERLIEARAGTLRQALASLPPTTEVLAAGARLEEATRLMSDALLLQATDVSRAAATWRANLADAATNAAQTAPAASLRRAGLMLLALKSRTLAPALASTPDGSARLALSEALVPLVPHTRILPRLPAVDAVGLADLPNLSDGWTITNGPTAFTDLTATTRNEVMTQPYSVANPERPVWEAALAGAVAAADRVREELRSARGIMNANANYTTTRKVSYIESNGTKVMERTETEVNQIMKGTYEVAAGAAARAELALGQAEAVVAQVRAAEPPVRLARTGSYTVTWQEWHGTAVTPRNATGRDGRVRDLSRRTPIAESDRRSPGFSAVGMLPAEGLPPQDGWRTRTAVEQALAQREAVAADLGVNQALHQEVLARVRDPGDAPWAAWLLAGPGTPVLPPSLLTP